MKLRNDWRRNFKGLDVANLPTVPTAFINPPAMGYYW